jgi:hypothetical protein
MSDVKGLHPGDDEDERSSQDPPLIEPYSKDRGSLISTALMFKTSGTKSTTIPI